MDKERKSRQEYTSIREREAANKTYYQRDDGKALPPHTICISVNNNCFMTCKMCDIGTANSTHMSKMRSNQFSDRYIRTRQYQELPLERIKALVDEMAPHKPIIKTNFVEPLLYKQLKPAAEYIKMSGLKYYTITNGWVLEKNAPWLAETCDLIRVSLDGTASVHDVIRGKKGSFDRTIRGIKALIKAKKALGRDRPIVGVCFTVSNYNYNNLLDFMETLQSERLLEDLYVNFNHLLYLTEWEIERSKAVSNLFEDLKRCSVDDIVLEELDIPTLKQQVETLYERFPQTDYHYYFSPWLESQDLDTYYDPDEAMFPDTPCYLPWYAAQLDIEGNMGVYGHCILPDFGNAFEDGFMNAWNSARACEIRKELKKSGSFPGCNKCIGTLYPLRGRD